MSTVAVIGCGVIGLSSALAIQRQLGPKTKVVIFTEKLSPHTTGDVAAGIWCPAIQNNPKERIHKWAKGTKDFVVQLWKNGEAKEAGVSLFPAIVLSEEANFLPPSWLDVAIGHSELSPESVRYFSEKLHRKLTGGYTFVTFTLEQSKFLPYLQRKFVEAGGEVHIRRIKNFEELSQFDVIVNCTGLYSRILVPDSSVHPVRGQIARVSAPWQFHALMVETEVAKHDETHVIPNQECVILGRTYQKGDFNTDVSEDDGKRVVNSCCKLIPSLQQAPIIKHSVGLRPGRDQVRLELEYRRCGDKMIKIVHNYGHGGNGITLSAGCALETAQLVKKSLTRSKL